MAAPELHATVEAQVEHAAGFCELVSQWLAMIVFHTPVLVTPGLLWHFAGATLSCSLRYGQSLDRLTVHNSAGACRWLTRLAPGWHPETQPLAFA
jgi:hypothetical protein